MQKLNSIGDTAVGPSCTVISTVFEEVVIPYNSQYLNGPAQQATNITIQDVAHALGRASGPTDLAYQPRRIQLAGQGASTYTGAERPDTVPRRQWPRQQREAAAGASP